MLVTIDQQITWLKREVEFYKSFLPIQVKEGRMSEEKATHMLACATAAMHTMAQLRGIVRSGEPS